MFQQRAPQKIAVVGAGVSGLSAAWLLSQRHEVTLFEQDGRIGGHSHTVEAAGVPVDTGFIVFNEANYPNLTALFAHLGVQTRPAPMSFAVSMDEGRLEYSSDGLRGLFAQKRNLANPRFLAMIGDLLRFQKTAPGHLASLEGSMMGLDAYLAREGYGRELRDLHLLPQAAAIWSSSLEQMADYPAASFIRFYQNHRLLKIDVRPTWRTVEGGSRAYVTRLLEEFRGEVRQGCKAIEILRSGSGCGVRTSDGRIAMFDQVVIAAHADQALSLLADPTADETRLLSAIPYQPNRVVLHRDPGLMPRRRSAWAAWNHIGRSARAGEGGVTYWMNRLQGLPGEDLFVSLNPTVEPAEGTVLLDQSYEHPVFGAAAVAAQKSLWRLQGVRGTWFCGAWFGWGFHEDGLQSGLAVAEQLGGVRRPWSVENESGRIHLAPADADLEAAA